MPFSFKPDIATEAQGGAQPAVPQAAPASSPLSVPPSIASAGSAPAERSKAGGVSMIEIILFAVFGFTALVAAGLFAYKFYLSSQVEAKKAALNEYESRLNGLPLQDMRDLSNRLKIVNQLVKDHPSVNVAFMIVEASIENSITFTKFDLRYIENTKSYQLALGGSSPDYKSIAQQMDTYKNKPYSNYMQKIGVEGLHPDTSGRILFSFTIPISIKGLIPETFSIMSSTGSSTVSIPTGSIPANRLATTTVATTTPPAVATTTMSASSTKQVRKP